MLALPVDPVTEAEKILAERFAETGWIETIVSIQLKGTLLRVTLDRSIQTLGQAEVYSKMCHALSTLITSEEFPSEGTGVQFFRNGGGAVVASGAHGAPCGRFWDRWL